MKAIALKPKHNILVQDEETKHCGIENAICLAFNFLLLFLLIASCIKLFTGLMLPSIYTNGYEEFSCASQKSMCLSLLCPEGMTWIDDKCLPSTPDAASHLQLLFCLVQKRPANHLMHLPLFFLHHSKFSVERDICGFLGGRSALEKK